MTGDNNANLTKLYTTRPSTARSATFPAHAGMKAAQQQGNRVQRDSAQLAHDVCTCPAQKQGASCAACKSTAGYTAAEQHPPASLPLEPQLISGTIRSPSSSTPMPMEVSMAAQPTSALPCSAGAPGAAATCTGVPAVTHVPAAAPMGACGEPGCCRGLAKRRHVG